MTMSGKQIFLSKNPIFPRHLNLGLKSLNLCAVLLHKIVFSLFLTRGKKY